MLHGIKTYYVVYFQTPTNGPTSPEDWIQFSVRLGGTQCGSNFNAHISYVFIDDATALDLHIFSVQQDRKIYDWCHRYDGMGFCSPNIFINPDLAIVAGCTPTLYGEVESNRGRRDDTVIDKLNQAVARILCYTNNCFSVYAKSDELKILFYQRDENVGKVYVQTEQYTHSPTIPGSQPL